MDLMVLDAKRKLVQDAQEIQVRFETLEQDRRNWARKCEEEDLAEMMEYLKHLESDVSILQADCVISMSQAFEGKGPRQLFDVWHGIFSRINTLFEDVKTLRTELNESCIQTADLAQLKIDWRRFRKTLRPLEESL